MGSILCEHCTAACCRYLALPLDKPTTVRDFDDIRWYLLHEGISVFVEEGEWFVQIQTRCRHIRHDSRCGVYETRPRICREYEPVNCDYTTGAFGYDHLFTHPEQIVAYYENKTGRPLILGAKSAPGKRSRRKPSTLRRSDLVPLKTRASR
jgi:Fe-S-cluster containining protein